MELPIATRTNQHDMSKILSGFDNIDQRIHLLLQPLEEFNIREPELDSSPSLKHSVFFDYSKSEIVASVEDPVILKYLMDFAIVQSIVQEYYDIGEVVRISKLSGGVINDSFKIECSTPDGNKSFFFRRYAENKKEKWIELEHLLLRHLHENDFIVSAKLVPAKSGNTWLGFPDSNGKERLHMITTLLDGENKYSHEKNDLDFNEIISLGSNFAQFHNIASTLSAPNYRPRQIPSKTRILNKFQNNFFPELPKLFSDIVRNMPKTEVSKAIFESDTKQALLQMQTIPDKLTHHIYLQLPHVPVHHDLHPGNALYKQNEVSGIFDLDFVKIDARVFDVALTSIFLCTDWTNANNTITDGPIDLTKMMEFIRAYQHPENQKLESGLGKLNKLELEAMVPMMQIANVILIHWYLNDFNERIKSSSDSLKEVDVEYSKVIKQRIAAAVWLSVHENEIIELLMKI